LEATLDFVVLTAPQAFTLAAAVKAEKLNSAIEKRHRLLFRGVERTALYRRCG
jgi:hypothetical protein